MYMIARIQSSYDRVNNLLAKDELTDDEIHELNRLYNELFYYLEHEQREDNEAYEKWKKRH